MVNSAGMMDALLIAGNLGRFVETMKENPDNFEMSDHDSLLNVAFQYLGTIFDKIGTRNVDFDLDDLNKTKERIMELLK